MTDEHLKALRDSRKVYASDKIVRHNNNYVEVINYEKRMKVYPKNDELLDMINSVERFDAEWNCITNMSWDEYRNYRYEDLPSKLRAYMSSIDAYYFAVWLSKLTKTDSFERYERAEDRLLQIKGEVADDDFVKHVLLGNPIPNTVGKKAKDSARRSYKQVNAYIKSNIHRFTRFVTLTFAQAKNKFKYENLNADRLVGEHDLKFDYVDATDFEFAKKALKKTMDDIRKKLKKDGLEFYYITVWELQKNGNYHFHILCSDIPNSYYYKVPKWLDFNFIKNEFNNGDGLLNWKFGKSDVQVIKSPNRVGTYVSKYIIKSFLNYNEETFEEYLNKKKYFVSQNLEKPIIDYYNDNDVFERDLKSLSLDGLEGYVKEYCNPYNDSKIVNKIYTKIDFEKEKTNRKDDSLND